MIRILKIYESCSIKPSEYMYFLIFILLHGFNYSKKMGDEADLLYRMQVRKKDYLTVRQLFLFYFFELLFHERPSSCLVLLFWLGFFVGFFFGAGRFHELSDFMKHHIYFNCICNISW